MKYINTLLYRPTQKKQNNPLAFAIYKAITLDKKP